jgi:protein SCO1
MNKSCFTVFVALTLSACSGAASLPVAGPLVGARMGGAFSLTNQDGKTVKDTDFRGRYYIVYFGFTFCPDICPTDGLAIGAGLKLFEADQPQRAAKVTPVFITADPARDTPPILKAYLRHFHPRFVGLTGSVKEIDAVAQRYGVTIMREDPDSKGEYRVDHGRYATLYGPDGKPIGFVDQEDGPKAVAAALERWVR